jgi:death-on-curing protein
MVNLAILAAAYGFGVARNPPFTDGNKRTALASIVVFLGLNGLDLDAPPPETTAMILGMAAGEISEDTLARWISGNVKTLEAPGIQP